MLVKSKFERFAAISLLLTLFLTGCASVPETSRDARDPWQGYNRHMFQFNDDFDKSVGKPVAKGYNKVLPEPVNNGISNFFNNFADVTSAVNNLLQFKLTRAGTDVGRVVVNSTVGLLGFIDVASNLDLPSYKEDFGQTLGYWGVAPGPYFVLPLLGPNTVRDTVGLVVGLFTNPLNYVSDDEVRTGLGVLRAVDQRAALLGVSRVLEEAALDPYEFTKEAYMQKRRYDVYDGNPPLSDDFFNDGVEDLKDVPETELK